MDETDGHPPGVHPCHPTLTLRPDASEETSIDEVRSDRGKGPTGTTDFTEGDLYTNILFCLFQ